MRRVNPAPRTAKPSPLADNLKRTRLAWGWTQATMSRYLECDTSTISMWENAKIRPEGPSRVAIAALLGVTVDDLDRPKLRVPSGPSRLPVFTEPEPVSE